MSNLADAINQAKDAAANVVPMDEAPQGGTQIETYKNAAGVNTPAMPPSFDNFSAAKGLFDRSTPYIKPTEFGAQVGKNKKNLIDEFEAEITLVPGVGMKPKWTIRYGQNPQVYVSSYDGVQSDKGGAWQDAIMKAKSIDPKADPYPAAEVKLVLTKDLKLKDETLKAGTVLAYDTSAPSRYSDFEDLLDAAREAGVMGQTVKVKVRNHEIEHNNNNWGTLQFDLLDAA